MDEGHEIGNHTYSHRNLAVMSEWQMELELTATQRLIESITGRSNTPTLFRPPYNADSNPTDIAELAPLRLAQEQLGYTVVLEKIDPQDWARPGTEEIIQRVKDLRNEGNIILLHDAGGDRSETVAALPHIIDYLQTRGDRIVSLSELLGMTRDELMPPIDTSHQPLERFVAGTGFRAWHGIVGFFWAFMIFSTGLVVARTLLVAWLARRHHRMGNDSPTAFQPSLSIVIAAFNEGKVIQKTLRSVLDTDYAGELEVVVVDDGSRDDTAAKVEALAATEPRVRLVHQSNRGKAAALRHGVAQARHEIVVFLDADTQFQRSTLHALVQPLAHPLVGAVSGNARVGNLRTFIARFQSLEYICGFNLDRRAYTEWNCITVVPGAISALRRSAINAAGGFSDDTLAEDTDLTLTLHRLGYHIEYAPDAVAWTEAPETYVGLARQRFRWGLRHDAMPVEASRSGLQSPLWSAGLVQPTQYLVHANRPRRRHAAGRWHPALFAHSRAYGRHLVLVCHRARTRSFPCRPWPAGWMASACTKPFSFCRCASSIAPSSPGSSGARSSVHSRARSSRGENWSARPASRLAHECPAFAHSSLPSPHRCSPLAIHLPRPLRRVLPSLHRLNLRLRPPQHRHRPIPCNGLPFPSTASIPVLISIGGDKEDTVTLEAVEKFETLVGKHQAIVASSSYWGEQSFPEDNLRLITRHGSVPLVFWSPWGPALCRGPRPGQVFTDQHHRRRARCLYRYVGGKEHAPSVHRSSSPLPMK